MMKSTESLPEAVLRRLEGRPYYCYLYALNVLGGRLPAILEECMPLDPHCAYLYARYVLKGRFSDNVHNALVIGSFGDVGGSSWVAAYMGLFR